MLNRGFSATTGYSCLYCHSKCCTTPYRLPLQEFEEIDLIKRYPQSFWYIQRENNRPRLDRIEQCLFLLSDGNCHLHNIDSSTKPLVCQVYPLIFWKTPFGNILAYIFPCGTGFRWNNSKFALTETQISESYTKCDHLFEVYFADYYDEYNSFEGASEERFHEEVGFQLQKKNNIEFLLSPLLERSSEEKTELFMKEVMDFFFRVHGGNNASNKEYENEISPYVNSALVWLSFNPLIFDLETEFALKSRLLAAVWGEEFLSSINWESSNHEIQETLGEQAGWIVASAATEDFWLERSQECSSEALKNKFPQISDLISQVLKEFST